VPKYTDRITSSRIDSFTDPDFTLNVMSTEALLNNDNAEVIPVPKRIKKMANNLNTLFGHEHVKSFVEIVGYAYMGDRTGALLVDKADDTIQGLVEYDEDDDVTYLGIEIINVQNSPDGKPNYKVVCKFKLTSYDTEGIGRREIFYIPPSDVLHFQPRKEYDENETLLTLLDNVATESESLVKNYHFTLAASNIQHRTLRIISSGLREKLNDMFTTDDLKIDADEFFIVTYSKDNEIDNVNYVNPAEESTNKGLTPQGVLVGIEFLETITHERTQKLRSLARNYPCFVLDISGQDAMCLVPIRAFNAVVTIDDTLE
jgi:hypothetical protein